MGSLSERLGLDEMGPVDSALLDRLREAGSKIRCTAMISTPVDTTNPFMSFADYEAMRDAHMRRSAYEEFEPHGHA